MKKSISLILSILILISTTTITISADTIPIGQSEPMSIGISNVTLTITDDISNYDFDENTEYSLIFDMETLERETKHTISEDIFWSQEGSIFGDIPITNITFTEKVKVIGKGYFRRANILCKEIIIPATVEKIEMGAFAETDIEKIIIEGTPILERGSLGGLSLKEIEFKQQGVYESLSDIFYYLYGFYSGYPPFSWGCNEFSSLKVNAVAMYNSFAFCNTEQVIISKNTRFIKDLTWRYWDSTDDYLGYEIKEIVFEPGIDLSDVYVTGDNKYNYEYSEHPTDTKISALYSAFSNSDLESIVLPPTLQSLEKTFENSTKLKSVILPDGLERIGKDSFKDCTSLTSITIPSTVTHIAGGAFANCNSLKNVYINSDTPIELDFIPTATLEYVYDADHLIGGIDEDGWYFFHLSELSDEELENFFKTNQASFFKDYVTNVSKVDDKVIVTTKAPGEVLEAETLLWSVSDLLPAYQRDVNPNATSEDLVRFMEALPNISNVSVVTYPQYGEFLSGTIKVIATPDEEIDPAFDVNSNDLTLWIPRGSLDDYKNAECWQPYIHLLKEIDYNLTVEDYEDKVLSEEKQTEFNSDKLKIAEHIQNKENNLSNVQISQYLDIELFKTGYDFTDETMHNNTLVEEDTQLWEVRVPIPQNLISDNIDLYIIRVHNSLAETLDSEIQGNEIVFYTDRFSTYALAYKDNSKVTEPEEPEEPEEPKEPEEPEDNEDNKPNEEPNKPKTFIALDTEPEPNKPINTNTTTNTKKENLNPEDLNPSMGGYDLTSEYLAIFLVSLSLILILKIRIQTKTKVKQ